MRPRCQWIFHPSHTIPSALPEWNQSAAIMARTSPDDRAECLGAMLKKGFHQNWCGLELGLPCA